MLFRSMIPKEEIKERKVEIIKDVNSTTETEKEIADKKEQERKERKFLYQLIAIFITWVFLIILLMRNERKVPEKPKVITPPKVNHPKVPAHTENTINQIKNPTPLETKPKDSKESKDSKDSKDSNTKQQNQPGKNENVKDNLNNNPKSNVHNQNLNKTMTQNQNQNQTKTQNKKT